MNYLNDKWNNWTVKSDDVPFKSTENAVGDGEQKLGFQFDVVPLGQNYAYDLEINGEKWEVKKLDADNSFRLGVEVATHYTPIISNVIRVFENLLSLKNRYLDGEIGIKIKNCISKIETQSGRSNTLLLDGLRKNEVSESNLDKANEIIEELKGIILNKGELKLYSSVDGIKRDYQLLIAFKKIIIEDIPIDEKIKLIGNKETYNRLLITDRILEDLSVFDNSTLREKLNSIIRNVFSNVRLVLVHEKLGFKPISELNTVYCNRITSGLPRCKIK